ncbi:MAG: mechanosensitive ion channel family protein [Holosporales bacterium]|jgi:small-conductance mechanosensitive channel/CRP-like cAMP-binding protein|nr:mechanosensitive ion channel family protein [Holosporales bacterium]
MNWRVVSYTVIGAICIGLLLFFYRAADPISADNVGISYDIEQGVKALVIALLAWVIVRFVAIFCWHPIEKKHGKPVSRVLKDSIAIIIYAIAAVFILVCVYGKSATGVWASLMMTCTGIGYAGKSFIKDCIAGVILDFTGNFKTGDWIKLPDGEMAKVHRVKLRETVFKLLNDATLVLSNRKLLDDAMVNFSYEKDEYWDGIDVVLDSFIPVDRGRRILQAAASGAVGVVEKQAKVFASNVDGGSVSYKVFFKVPGFAMQKTVIHNVIQTIVQHLTEHNINLAEDTCRIFRGSDEANEAASVRFTPAFQVARLSPLFAECSETELTTISAVLTPKYCKAGEVIIAEKSTGSSMFFIAEGVVEISIQVQSSEKSPDASVKKHITYLVTNDFFGEGGVLHNSPRNATVSAHTDVMIYSLERENLKRILVEMPNIAIKISEAIITRREETADIASKTAKSLRDRKKLTSEFAAALRNFLGI